MRDRLHLTRRQWVNEGMRRAIYFLLIVSGFAVGPACNCGVNVAGELDPEGMGPFVPVLVPGDAGSGMNGSSDGGMADPDAGSGDDGGSDAGWDGGTDAGMFDAGTDAGTFDAGVPDAGLPDAGPPGPTHVHIFIDNFCNTSVSPTDVYVPLNSGLKLQFHNHSSSYEADVWSSRGYGYLELATGATWNDPITHCGGPQPYVEYFDVSIAGGPSSSCPGARFRMHCQ